MGRSLAKIKTLNPLMDIDEFVVISNHIHDIGRGNPLWLPTIPWLHEYWGRHGGLPQQDWGW